MIIELIKQNKVTTDYVSIELEDTIISRKEGKIGKAVSFSSTINCGTNVQAKLELEKLINEYQRKGYCLSDGKINIVESETFDKAKWHLEDGFPNELIAYQAYIHTGFYIGWLVRNDLISDEFKRESEEEIKHFLDKKITCVKLFSEQLDGVFSSNDVNQTGLLFSKNYFDFEKGEYLKDYEQALATDLPTIFHVQDTWENFEKICQIITIRYYDWVSLR